MLSRALEQLGLAEESKRRQVFGLGGGRSLPALLLEGRQAPEIGIAAVGRRREPLPGLQLRRGGERRHRIHVLVAAESGPERGGGEGHVTLRHLVVAIGFRPSHLSPQRFRAGDLAGLLETLGVLHVTVQRFQRLLSHVQDVGGQSPLEVAVRQLGGELLAGAAPLRIGDIEAGLGGAIRGPDAPAGEHRPARVDGGLHRVVPEHRGA